MSLSLPAHLKYMIYSVHMPAWLPTVYDSVPVLGNVSPWPEMIQRKIGFFRLTPLIPKWFSTSQIVIIRLLEPSIHVLCKGWGAQTSWDFPSIVSPIASHFTFSPSRRLACLETVGNSSTPNNPGDVRQLDEDPGARKWHGCPALC